MSDWFMTLFGKWANIKKASPEEQECVDFFKEIRELLKHDKLNAMGFHVSNEYSGDYKPVFGMLQKAMGKISGMADYCFLWKGGGCLIEFKRPDGKGKVSAKQVAVQEWAKHVGVSYHLVSTKEEALKCLPRDIIG